MKLVSIFFTASAEIFKVYLKDSEYCTVLLCTFNIYALFLLLNQPIAKK